MKQDRMFVKSVLCGIVLTMMVVMFATATLAQDPPSLLFQASAEQASLDSVNKPTIRRYRSVTIQFANIAEADGSPKNEPGKGDVVTLNLFDDVSFTAVRDRVDLNPSGSFSWIGHLKEVENSLVTLVVRENLMAGNIALPAASYQVRYVRDGVHAIYDMNQSAFGECATENEPITLAESPAQEVETPMADTGSSIDVMVAYTATTRAAAGGTTAMQTLIDLAISESNTGYAHSGITQRLNLVHTVEVSYTESGNIQTDRNRLQNPSDGYIDNVHALRDAYKADLVPMIVENGGGYCGIAYIMNPVSTTFANYGFAIVARDCATGYYSFAHELGHIMSARHDWYVDSTNNSPYTYNHGYVAPSKAWRTIMAYGNDCSGCTRLNYWSNPNVSYGGTPMGVAEGQYHAADNRKTLNNTAYTIANFRQRSVPTGNSYLLWTNAATSCSGVTIPGNYSGTTVGRPTWNRPNANGTNPPTSLSSSATNTPYHVQVVCAATTRTYTLDSSQSGSWDGYLCLYQNAFNPASPLTNVMVCNDDYGSVGASRITKYLTSGTTYYLVTTGYSNTSSGTFTNTMY